MYSFDGNTGLSSGDFGFAVFALLHHAFPSDDVSNTVDEHVDEINFGVSESVSVGDIELSTDSGGVDTGSTSGLESELSTDILEVGSGGELGDHAHASSTETGSTVGGAGEDETEMVGVHEVGTLSGEDLLDVISYEGSRIFRDRMVDEESESKLDSIMSTTLRSKFQFIPSLTDIHFTTMGLAAIGGHTKYLNQQRSESSGPDSLNTPLLVRTTRTEFQSYVQKGVEHYERETAELNMLLFPQILEHISRVDRVISNPGGNLLLIGRSGVGRRTADRKSVV